MFLGLKRKGQSSVEYILIVAFSLLMIIPSTILFMNYSSDSKASVESSQVFKVGNELILSAEKMYSVGQNSWQTLTLIFPDNFKRAMVYTPNIGVAGLSELVITYGDPATDVVLFSRVPLFNETDTDCVNGCVLPFHAGPNRIRSISTTTSNRGIVRYVLIE